VANNATMKVITLLTFLPLAVTAATNPTRVTPPTKVLRDAATVTNEILLIEASITALDEAVVRFKTNPIQVEQDAACLIRTLESGRTIIAKSGALASTDLPALAAIHVGLENATQSLMTDFAVKKPAFASAGLCAELNKTVSSIITDGIAVINAFISLVPEESLPAAEVLSASLIAVFNEGLGVFSPTNCTTSGSNHYRRSP
jgi:hypothetical protein